MFSLVPFRIISYPPKIAAFGGAEYPYEGLDVKTVTREVGGVVSSLGDSLKRAYEVKTAFQIPKEDTVSTRVTPIEAELDERAVDMDLRRSANSKAVYELKCLLGKISARSSGNAVIIRKDQKGFYFVHDMKKSFDPVSLSELLQTVECLLFEVSGQKVEKTSKKIRPGYLEVDVKLKMPDSKLYY